MTVTRATTIRPLVDDGRLARGRGRVSEARYQAASNAIGAPTIIADDAAQRGWLAPCVSALVPSAR